MLRPPDDGSTDTLSVSPSALQAAAPTYYKAAQDIDTLQKNLVATVQQATNAMFLLYELARFAATLEHLHQRISVAMECASKGLTKMGVALEVASEDFAAGDQEVSNTFKKTADDPNVWNIPTKPVFPIPGLNTDPNPPIVQPQPQPVIPLPIPFPLPGGFFNTSPGLNVSPFQNTTPGTVLPEGIPNLSPDSQFPSNSDLFQGKQGDNPLLHPSTGIDPALE